MNDDLLSRAAGALREAAGHDARDETLARVLRDVRRGERRRRFTGMALVPFAIVLTTVGAWAATTDRLTAVARKLWPRPEAVTPVVARPHRGAAVPPPEIVPIAPRAPEAPVAAVPQPRRQPSLPLRSRPTVAPAPLLSADELYRRAHEAHFGRGDYAAALTLWDQYLATSPLPRLVIEARYDRAIALLHLGRRDEAARVLRPFADGDYGAYRAAEARALLRATGVTPSE